MVLRFLFNFLLLSAVVNLYGAEKNSTPEIKVAIVAQDVKGESLTDAVTAELSGRNVICVERAEIKKVLAEQKLSASGLVDPANIVKCCQLLKVDLFTVIVCSPKTRVPVGIIVFDTRLGLRLADIGLPEKFDDQVKLTADTVTAAIARQQQLNAGKLKLISFMPLNLIALKGKEADSARLAELVLMRLLGQNQSILLLERSQLDFLLKERSLHPDNDNQLLAGSLFIQLEPELSGDKAKPLTLKLFAKDITGKVYFSLRETYAIDDEVKAAEHLAAETGKQLGTTVVTGNFDRKREAAKYISESYFAKDSGMYERASRMARNAYALNPDSRQELIGIEAAIARAYLSDTGSRPSPENVDSAVEHAEFLFEIENDSIETNQQIGTIMSILASVGDSYCNANFSSQLKVRISKLREQTATLLLRSYDRQYKPINTVTSANDMQEIVQRIESIKKIAYDSKYNDISDKYGLPLKELYVANIDRFYTPETPLGRCFYLFEPGPKPWTPRLAELYRAMQKTSVPYFKIIGTLHLYAINYPNSWSDPSYTDFMIEVFEKDHIPDQYWALFKLFCCQQFISLEDELKLYRSIYKKRRYDKDPLSCIPLSNILFSLSSRIHYENGAMKFYSFIKEIQDDVRNDNKMTVESKTEIISTTNMHIRDLKSRFPNLKISEQELPQEKYPQIFQRIINLISQDGINSVYLSQPLYDGKNIYAARLNSRNRFLYRISPENGFSKQPGEKLLTEEENGTCDDNFFACLSKEYYITATTAGLFLFPLNLSVPEYVPLKEVKGFNCYAIACMNEKVYMSFDGSTSKRSDNRKTPCYLVEYDLRKKSYSVVYASNQSEHNPFQGNSDLQQLHLMYADTVRNRLIFGVMTMRMMGLWALNLPSRSWVRLVSLPYFDYDIKYPYNMKYHPFIIAKNENTLIIMGANIVYEYDTVSNQAKLKFYSGNPLPDNSTNGEICEYDPVNKKYYTINEFPPIDKSVRMKYAGKWKELKPGWKESSISSIDLDGNKLWTSHRLIFLDQKKALKLTGKQGNDYFEVYLVVKGGRFVVTNNLNCTPNGSLMAMELKSDRELLNLPELEDIAP